MQKEENKEEYKKRASAAESPIGNIKHNLKFGEFTRRKYLCRNWLDISINST